MKIHSRILKPLLIFSPIIALFASLFTLYIQLSQMEEKVLVLAKNEVKHFTKDLELRDDMHTYTLELSDTNFLNISILNTEGLRIYSNQTKDYRQIQNELKKIDHHLTTKSDPEYQERLIHNHIKKQFYFQFKAPIQTKNFRGYVQGLYHISSQEVDDIYTNIFYSLVQLLSTVFITTLLLYPLIVYLNKSYMQQSQNLLQANLEIMSVLGSAIAKRDSDTNAHNYRVTLYAIAFAKELRFTPEKMMGLIKGAFLHDIGKIGVSDIILLKPNKLTSDEFEKMKLHVEYGVDIISKSRWLDDARDVIAYHHEKYNGQGYNQTLKGTEIPLNARLFMICDVFDALISKRPYKKEMNFNDSIKKLKGEAGSHFDPHLVDIFQSFIFPVFKNITQLKDEELHQLLMEKLKEFYH